MSYQVRIYSSALDDNPDIFNFDTHGEAEDFIYREAEGRLGVGYTDEEFEHFCYENVVFKEVK